MKKIIIIGAHPDKPHKVEMLENCIEHIIPLGYDIMLVSHCEISEKIQKKVNYFLFDKENLILSGDFFPKTRVITDNFTFIGDGPGHHTLAVTKNIINGINFVDSLGYQLFFFMECDNIIHSDDLFKIDTILKTMIHSNKKMFFFNNTSNGIETFETLMFGGNVSYFKHNNKFPSKESDYNGKCLSLERLVYLNYEKNIGDLYILKTTSEEYFSKSEINLITLKYVLGIFPSNDASKVFLFFSNLHHNKKPIFLQLPDEEIREYSPGTYHIRRVDDYTVNVKIISDGVEEMKTLQFDLKNSNLFGDGLILFNGV
jgi:hypothetical protein